MQFTRLRLVGFKSFVEPAEFVIERGLTGVVGPNGCGKSNLVEALRWVMGENSYKNMRASGMDDVIFSGSGLRPARNAAEVTLYLDNSDRSAPDVFNDADELQVSRRIERDKGSAYRINGRDVRAKDVQLLFADQSTGARSPSMVGQGRIGELISARPQARRALLEEAAGISGLHSRRREAEQRLRAAGGNLDRLEDIAGDLAGRIEGLKRQARQAQRFRQLSADIRKAEAGLFYVRWVEAKSQEAEAQSRFSTATVAVGEAAAVQIRAARAQEAGRAELPAAREAAVKAQAAVQRLRLGAQTLEAEQDRVRQRHAELTGRLQQLAEDIAREEALLQENADNAQRLDGEEAQLLEEDTATAGEEQRLADALQQIAVRVTEQEEVLAVARANQAERNAAHGQLQRLIAETAARDKKLAADIAAAEADLNALAADIASMAAADDLRAQSAQQAGLLAEAEEKAAAAENAVLRARTRETEVQAQSAEARDTLRGYEAEARTLQQMLAAFAGEGHAAVVEGLVVKRGFEIVLGAALGDDLEASFDTAAPICWQDMSMGMSEDPAMPAGVLPLADVVEAPAPLQRRLAQIGIVEMQEAAALQPQLATGQCLVSREGALWRWDGLTARADAPTAAAQRLAQKNRLGELAALLGKARLKAEAAHAALEEVQDMVRRKVEHERAVRTQAADLRRNLDTLRYELAGLERRLGERISRRDALQENRARLAADYRENAARLAGMEEKRKALPPPDAQEKTIAASNSRLADLRTAMAQAHAAQAAWRHALQSRKNRQALLAGERETWRQRIANSERQLHTLRQRHEAAAAEMQQLAATPDDFETRKSALFDEIAKAETTAQAVTDRLAEVERAQAALDRAALEAVQALSAVREERVRAEERLNAASDRRAAIEANIAEALSCLPHETMTHAGFTDGARLPDAQALERNLEKLRLERERLGAVNLQAEDESAEITKRYEVLVAERDDVIAAIKKLRLAIHTLNREGRERLLEAFDKVNLSFQHLFSHLFGGGTAELQLVESEDPLEAGLEILARPPGKKPQTMTLLSGGEQALTAMALIFAVFLTNPAPVCVLDEVDAPLDDHNVERYCNLMDEMAASTKTRFIIITHNPITMARMNRLFGVTMGEQGVSQLVSVDLQTASDIRETV